MCGSLREIKLFLATYSGGRALVREKYLQTYNTSSAEEHIEAAKFRRQHPGLSLRNSESFEDMFPTKKSVNCAINHGKKENTSSADKSLKDGNKKTFEF